METHSVICLVRDLLFFSKIRAAAQSAGVTIKNLRDPEKLADESGVALLVDLGQDGCLQAAASWRQRTGKAVIGFASHVDVETIKAAKAAGIDRVMTRGQFDRDITAILKGIHAD
jgi:aminoglycoside/choline kinase family phosphotransferase